MIGAYRAGRQRVCHANAHAVFVALDERGKCRPAAVVCREGPYQTMTWLGIQGGIIAVDGTRRYIKCSCKRFSILQASLQH
jgi:hypothetical protein